MGLVHVRSDADDVVQEAALQAVKRLSEFRAGTNFRAWMAQIVRYVASNQNRGRRRERSRGGASVEAFADVAPARTPAPATPVDSLGRVREEQGAFDDALVRALKSVEPTARACLLLRTVEGLAFRELAALLDIPEGTAMSHVFRARAQVSRALRDELAQEGRALPDGPSVRSGEALSGTPSPESLPTDVPSSPRGAPPANRPPERTSEDPPVP